MGVINVNNSLVNAESPFSGKIVIHKLKLIIRWKPGILPDEDKAENTEKYGITIWQVTGHSSPF